LQNDGKKEMRQLRIALVIFLAGCQPEAPRMDKDSIVKLIESLAHDRGEMARRTDERLVAEGKENEAVIPVLISGLEHKSAFVRHRVASVLGRMGPKAKPAVPALARMFSNRAEQEDNRHMACNALGLIGSASLPTLADALKQKEVFMRCSAAATLCRLAPDGVGAIPFLVEMLCDENEDVRGNAKSSLTRFGEKAVPALCQALKSHEPFVRIGAAAVVLNVNSSNKKDAAAVLAEGIRHAQPQVRLEAARAFRGVGPDGELAVPALIAALEDTNYWIRAETANALGNIGPGAKPAVPALIKALGDKEEDVRGDAAFALGMIGSASKEVLQALISALNDESEDVQAATVRALGKLGTAATSAIPALIQATKSPDERVSGGAEDALFLIRGKTGPKE
jgi:HEAT repeat protein